MTRPDGDVRADGDAQVVQPATARQAEALLLDWLDDLLPKPGAGRDALAVLARPVRIVVPTKSLRRHLLATLPAARGRAVVGVQVQTLAGLAAELLREAGQQGHHADALLAVLVRRRAADIPSLADALGDLDDGLASLARPVGDLLDAGFRADRDAVALAELVGQLQGGDDERLRALGILEVAGLVQQDLDDLGLARSAESLRGAAALLRADPDRLAARACLLHGFVDPSVAEQELLMALLSLPHSRALVVSPLPPGGDAPAPDELAVDLAGAAAVQVLPAGPGPDQLDLASAPGRTAEARHVARQLRKLLDDGVRPEGIAVVAREPATWAGILRPELEALGIPVSAGDAKAPAGPAQRRLEALVDVLARRGSCPVDRWLDAAVRFPGAGRTPIDDLRLAMRSLGLVRLSEVAAADPADLLGDHDSLPLPVRRGVVGDSDGTDQPDDDDTVSTDASGGRLPRRRLPGPALVAACSAARALLDGLDDDAPRPLRGWTGRLQALVADQLGWGDPDAAWRALRSACDGLVQRIGVDLLLQEDELRLLLGPALQGAAAGPFGGEGGGVQLLSAIEARGRCFQQLFVLGLTRGELPRRIPGDALLSAPLRRVLSGLLPGLDVSARRARQERRLLDHLLGSAPVVHLSWPASDDDGKLLPPSPLVEALRLARSDLTVRVLPPLLSSGDPVDGLQGVPRPPVDHALRRALNGDDDDDAVALLALALATPAQLVTADPLVPPQVLATAQARTRVRQELDAAPGRFGLGPYLGMVGPIGAKDPRHGPVAVTVVERMATCGWQAMIASVLRIEAPPDASLALPSVDARMVGIAVHRVLELICQDAFGQQERSGTLASLQALHPVAVPWPTQERLDQLIGQTCRDLVRQEGLGLPGLWRLLDRLVRPYLDVARSMDWSPQAPAVLGIEVQGEVRVHLDDVQQVVGFRADRADMGESGGLVLTDYKSGRPLSGGKRASTRDRDMLNRLGSGQKLQAAVYARAGGDGAMGRYLSLRPDVAEADAEHRVDRIPGVELLAEDADQVLEAVMQRVLAAWRSGAMLPRLVDGAGKEPSACGWCDYRAACLQGDSTARLRLQAWASAEARDERDEEHLARLRAESPEALRWWELAEDQWWVQPEASDSQQEPA